MNNKFIRVPYVSTVYDDMEINAVVECLKSSTQMGANTKAFEEKISKIYGHKYGLATNSGSSSLFLAMETLNIPEGSEVITPALTFATTVGCIIKNNLIPVFIDSESSSKFIINVNLIEEMISDKTKAMVIPNLMGNMPDWSRIRNIADRHNLLILEDSADLIGVNYEQKLSGEYADITISSFYGAHMITCAGNGGILTTSNKKYYEKAKLLRSWGRSSSLFSESESIENRFNVYLDNIRYDAKFIFEELGYMLEPSEIGCAYGLEQLKKLDVFTKNRNKVTQKHNNFFLKYSDFFELPEMDKKANSIWFAYPLIVKEYSPFTRTDMQIFLEKRNIQTRVIFTGNILRQPGFKNIKKRVAKGGYPIADRVMTRGILLANHHGLTDDMISHLHESVDLFIQQYSR
jgi:CDP-6-deoxy-D-xylo-4-hexulose-3-dehydrase